MKRLFIANRGEIAVRIIRTARERGVWTILGASEADKDSVAASMADEVVLIGPSEAAGSYLNHSAVLQAAINCRADALHPGYGFLSENADFSEECELAGITFVGPPASAMRLLGDKISAKQMARSVGVPLVPGFFEPGALDERLLMAAAEIGYPVMLKASAGGGGRGMRAVTEPSEFAVQLAYAQGEAKKAFGNSAMMVEKLVVRPRHIEVQALADKDGNVVILYERECSLQRRHQKLVEEAPSPLERFAEKMWSEMRVAAIKLLKTAGYVGAATVEFIVDEAGENFYFLEVNARLQVEHPVTEMVTGLDLVAWQLRIAEGEKLALPPLVTEGNRSGVNGHSIEVRIIAEDPGSNFLPSVGKILAWSVPSGPGVRVDSGFAEGSIVSSFYDSMLAKLIVHGEDRPAALAKLLSALKDFHVLGVRTNIEYLIDVVSGSSFQSGEIDTGTLERDFGGWERSKEFPEGLSEVIRTAKGANLTSETQSVENLSAWDRADRFRNALGC